MTPQTGVFPRIHTSNPTYPPSVPRVIHRGGERIHRGGGAGRAAVEVPAPPLAGGAGTAAPGRLGGPHPGPRAGGRGRLLLFGCGSPRRSHDTARPGPCRRLGRRGRAVRYGTRSPRAALSGRSRGGRSEAGGSRRGDAPASAPIRAPVPTGVLGWWTSSECYCGPGSGRSRRASRLNADARGWVRRLGRGQLGGGLPAQRGRGRFGGRRCTRGRRHTRPVRPVRLGAGAGGSVAERPDHSKRWPARIFHPPPPRAPPVPKWRNDAIPRTRRSRRAPERYAPSTFFRPADAPGRNGGAAGGLHRARTVIDTGPDRDGGGRQPVAPRESPHRPGSGPHQPDPSRPPSSVRPARTSAPTLGRGPARARRRDSGDQVAGLGAPGTRTGTATGNNGAFDDAEKSEDPHGHGDGARP